MSPICNYKMTAVDRKDKHAPETPGRLVKLNCSVAYSVGLE